MKRNIVCLLAIICLFATGCSFAAAIGEEDQSMGLLESAKNYLYNASVEHFLENRGILTDDTEAFDYANVFLTAALDHDVAAMKALFSPNAISEIGEARLDEMLNDFIDYFHADSFTLKTPIGPNTMEYRDQGKKSKELKGPLEVQSAGKEYRIAIRCVSCDDWAQDNIGIWSIYIIEKSKDSDWEHPYYGDLKYTSGIYFDVQRLE